VKSLVAAVCIGATTIGRSVWAQSEEPSELRVDVPGDRRSRAPSPSDLSAASSVVRGGELKTPGADAADVLSTIPGVQVKRTGSSDDPATASVRGASGAQLPVYLAGVRINDDVSGGADLSTLSLWMMDRVEVFRGASPERADRLGIAGAVFFEPKLPRATRVGGGVEVGSFGRLATWLGAEMAAPGAGALAMVRRERADNDYEFTTDQGVRLVPGPSRTIRRPNGDSETYDTWSIGRYRLNDEGAELLVLLNGFRREQGITGLGLFPATRSRSQQRRELGALSARVPCASGSEAFERCALELQTSLLEASQTLTDPLNELRIGIPSIRNQGERLVQQARLAGSPAGPLRWAATATSELERLREERENRLYLAAHRQVARLAASSELELGSDVELLLLGALACHRTFQGAPSAECSELESGGRLGGRWRATDALELLGNVSRAVRVPTLSELYGTSPLVHGNPSLGAETGYGADVGVRAAAGGQNARIWLDTFAFARTVSDLIAFKRTSLGSVTPFNVGRARMLGTETSLGTELVRHIKSELSVSLLDPRDTTPDRALRNDFIPFQSRLVLSDRTELFAEPALAALELDRAAIGARLSYRSSRVADPAGLIVLASEFLVDFDWTFAFFDRHLNLRLSVEDAFDARVVDFVGFPLPGRSVYAGVEVWWP
jgi:iron complex outermembrane receptor protein